MFRRNPRTRERERERDTLCARHKSSKFGDKSPANNNAYRLPGICHRPLLTQRVLVSASRSLLQTMQGPSSFPLGVTRLNHSRMVKAGRTRTAAEPHKISTVCLCFATECEQHQLWRANIHIRGQMCFFGPPLLFGTGHFEVPVLSSEGSRQRLSRKQNLIGKQRH